MTDALRLKSVEAVSVVSPDDRPLLKQVRPIDFQLLQYTSIFFNSKRNILKTVEVRKALATAIDRTALVRDVLHGSAVVVDGPFAPAIPGFAGPLQPAFSTEEANRILETAGWKRQEGSGIRKKGNDELALSLSVVDQPDDLSIGELVKKNWEAVGAKVELKPYDPTRIAKEVVKTRDYDAFIYGEILSPDGDLYPFWHSSQETDPGLNLSRFYNKDADKLLDELRTATNPAQIADKRIAFQKLLASNSDVVFLYSPYYTYGLAKRVKGFDTSYVTIPADRFNSISNWYVNTSISFNKK
jgi:peptide/nickel transport system substrate-binding protein